MKRDENVFSITDFAKFSRTTRDTLLYYDSIGLLSPDTRGKNHYRYYSARQLAIVNLIRTWQALGMSLTEIKQLKAHRTPERMDKTFEEQLALIDGKIDEWIRARKLLNVLKQTTRSALDIDEEGITVKRMPAEAIVLGDLNDYSHGRDDYDALASFYHAISQKFPNMDLNYSAWGYFTEARIVARDWVWPDRYYFNNPEGHDRKPAALYAIGYSRGGYGQTNGVYRRMLDYLNTNKLEICGPTFEEYPINEISVVDEKDYLMRVMITVREI